MCIRDSAKSHDQTAEHIFKICRCARFAYIFPPKQVIEREEYEDKNSVDQNLAPIGVFHKLLRGDMKNIQNEPFHKEIQQIGQQKMQCDCKNGNSEISFFHHTVNFSPVCIFDGTITV